LQLDRSCSIPHVAPKIRAAPVAHFRIQRACSSSAFLPSISCSVPTPATSTLLLLRILPTEQSAPLNLLLALLCLSTRLTAARARAHWWLTHAGVGGPLAAARRRCGGSQALADFHALLGLAIRRSKNPCLASIYSPACERGVLGIIIDF
jgi:hypothetical protein